MLLGSWRALFSDNLGPVRDSSQVPSLGWSPDSEISPKQLFLLLAQLPAPIVHKESTVRLGATTSPRTVNTPAKIPQDYAGEILTLGYPTASSPIGPVAVGITSAPKAHPSCRRMVAPGPDFGSGISGCSFKMHQK